MKPEKRPICRKCNGTGKLKAPTDHFMGGIAYPCTCGTPPKNTVARLFWEAEGEA